MQSNSKYQNFTSWFKSHGGIYNKICFPSQFPPINYIGVSAQQPIKANQVFLSVPKNLIISITKVRQSELGPILHKYPSLSTIDDEQTEFNILTLFLIRHKMLGEKSPYHPYFEIVQHAQTIINWSDSDILKLKDPNITLDLIQDLRKQFPIIYKDFQQISMDHPQLFPYLNYNIFMDCFALVMTRCFGWGLPQTMIVPFADFLNHNCSGVHHYTFNIELESSKNTGSYIKKRKQLDLSIFDIDNFKELPSSYARNQREEFIDNHSKLLPVTGHLAYNPKQRLNSLKTKHQLHYIHNKLMPSTYNIDLYPSSNSQDNDSEQQQPQVPSIKQRLITKQLKSRARKYIQDPFQQPKPSINRQFEDEIDFKWWYQKKEEMSYFIIAAHRDIEVGEQIYNSYGRRNNRFLLIWYGFTHANNKYDSVCFRLWDQKMYQKGNKLIFTKPLTPKTWKQQIISYPDLIEHMNITDQYRLKRDNINYQLLAYLRLRISRKNTTKFTKFTKNDIFTITNLQLELDVINYYTLILTHVAKQYNVHLERQKLSNKIKDYFTKILIGSYEQIISNHMICVQMLENVLKYVQNGGLLLNIYQEYASGKQDGLFRCRFAIGYFKMLDKFLKGGKKM